MRHSDTSKSLNISNKMSGWYGVKPMLCGPLVADIREFLFADTTPQAHASGPWRWTEWEAA